LRKLLPTTGAETAPAPPLSLQERRPKRTVLLYLPITHFPHGLLNQQISMAYVVHNVRAK
jgi:hypothetical protein